MNPALQEKLGHLPDKPGVYLYKNALGRVIYVGKAVSLRSRVRSYFQSSRGHSPKTLALLSHIADLEILVTSSEIDALILEGNLIKKHKPRYNILLKDDKSFPYLKLSTDEEYPRLLITRKPHEDGARYYGPYVHAGAMRVTQRLVQKHLGIRQCDIDIDRKRPRPCLYYDLHQCDAPCVSWGESSQQYQEHVRQAKLLLEGRQDTLLQDLKRRMLQASDKGAFEEAARLRDAVRALETVRLRQRVVLPSPKDVDVIALAGEDDVVVQVFYIRSGKLIDRQTCALKNQEGADASELLASFVPQFYAGGVYVPEEIVVSHAFEDSQAVEAWLGKKRGSKVVLSFPQRGEKLKWIRMVEENARQMLKEQQDGGATETAAPLTPAKDLKAGLEELKKVFKLAKIPKRIEGFDISHIQGSQTVASMVVLLEGRPENSQYRRYKIKTVKGVDDFKSMAEVVTRRYRRLLEEEGASALPDLILIDGGKGQLSAALGALKKLGLPAQPCFGLAKRLEEFFVPGAEKSLRLADRSPGRLMVQRLRDEAHRFAITYHRLLRSKALRHSRLDDVPGIGPALKKSLIAAFGSVEGVRLALNEDLSKIKGLSPQKLLKLREVLNV
jgi:excinuclease ABC subunit C